MGMGMGYVWIWEGRRRVNLFHVLGFNGAGQWDISTTGSGWAFFYT
jgi:hypothetical protein